MGARCLCDEPFEAWTADWMAAVGRDGLEEGLEADGAVEIALLALGGREELACTRGQRAQGGVVGERRRPSDARGVPILDAALEDPGEALDLGECGALEEAEVGDDLKISACRDKGSEEPPHAALSLLVPFFASPYIHAAAAAAGAQPVRAAPARLANVGCD